MSRALLIVAIAASVTIAAVTAVLWVRSYRGIDLSFGPSRLEKTTVTVNNGVLTWYGPHEKSSGLIFEYGLWRVFVGLALLWAIPLLYRRLRNPVGIALLAGLIHIAAFGLGTWEALPLVIAFDSLCVVYALRMYSLPPRTHNPGTCEKCGYDLRATPERCPECGTVTRV